MGATERVIQFIDFKGISKYKFCKDLGFSNKFLDNSSNMGTDKAGIILHYFPEINPEWLLTGEGEMLKSAPHTFWRSDEEIKKQETSIKSYAKQEQAVPELYLIPIEAMAGYGEGSVEVMEHEGEAFKVPTFRGAEFLISVKGSSMYPKYSSGDIVACKKIPLNDLFFQWNKVYVLDTIQGAIIKRIKRGSDENHILLISENPNYDSFELPLSSINAVSIVMGVIRLE